VQWEAEEIPADDDDARVRYQGIECPACARLHLINPSTGKLLGEA
jgi:hypothetical protein